jgi:hypothetical protein
MSSLSQYHHDDRPLIDRATNHWRRLEKSSFESDDESDDDHHEIAHCCDLDSDASFVHFLHNLCRNRRFRRAMFLIIVAFIALYLICNNIVLPARHEQQELLKGFEEPASFGRHKPGKFRDIVQVQQLPDRFIPGGTSDPDGKRRLIFIGDIHGCKDELLDLLNRVKFDKHNDKMIATGDVVAKGPDSPGVVDTLISLDALSVRGNHEDRILLAAKSHVSTGDDLFDASLESSVEESSSKSRGAGLKGEALLKYLKPHHLKYLESLPLIIHIPAITRPGQSSSESSGLVESTKKHKKQKNKKHFQITHDINIVHGGLVPSIPLIRQDPFSVMNMRSMSPTNHVPSEDRKKGVPWERVWGWYNDRIARTRSPFLTFLFGQATESRDASAWWKSWNGLYNSKEEDEEESGDLESERKHSRPSVVVYGHDSPRGLNLKKWSKGLDSGCVNGDQLTAMVLDAWGDAEIVSVDCKHRK